MSFNKHQMNKGKKLMEDTVFFLANPTWLMIAAAVCILEE